MKYKTLQCFMERHRKENVIIENVMSRDCFFEINSHEFKLFLYLKKRKISVIKILLELSPFPLFERRDRRVDVKFNAIYAYISLHII